MAQLHELSLVEVRDALAKGEVTASDVVDASLTRIEATEPKVDALLSVQADAARETAAALDAAGPDASKPLWGVPLIMKDVLCTKDVPTTCASKMLENFVPPFDATSVSKLKDAGAVITAKANMDEFAMGSSCENSAFKPPRNPWDTSRVPGGSSGGSAATVAAGQCYGSLGTDTGGSIRLPASFCGIVGVKPTYGRVSRYGLVAFASSLDQIGPMTRTVPDAALMLETISGLDRRDSTSVDEPVPGLLAAAQEQGDLSGVTIGLPQEYWGDGLDSEVRASCDSAIQLAKDMGAKTVEVSLPRTQYSIATYYIVAMAEASSNLARFDGVRYGLRAENPENLIDLYKKSRSQGFGEEDQRRILVGTYALSAGYYDAYYQNASQVRTLIR
jgi:aspartyl-tRNA(Asn)/glutamyl-tRNA(Gln) amidotransferase subunit A